MHFEEVIRLFRALSEFQPSEAHAAAPVMPWQIGQPYIIRTVTMINCGKLVWIGDKELVLSDAAWIADTGRWYDCLVDASVVNEAEPYVDDVIIGRGAIVDATKWHNERLPQK